MMEQIASVGQRSCPNPGGSFRMPALVCPLFDAMRPGQPAHREPEKRDHQGIAHMVAESGREKSEPQGAVVPEPGVLMQDDQDEKDDDGDNGFHRVGGVILGRVACERMRAAPTRGATRLGNKDWFRPRAGSPAICSRPDSLTSRRRRRDGSGSSHKGFHWRPRRWSRSGTGTRWWPVPSFPCRRRE